MGQFGFSWFDFMQAFDMATNLLVKSYFTDFKNKFVNDMTFQAAEMNRVKALYAVLKRLPGGKTETLHMKEIVP